MLRKSKRSWEVFSSEKTEAAREFTRRIREIEQPRKRRLSGRRQNNAPERRGGDGHQRRASERAPPAPACRPSRRRSATGRAPRARAAAGIGGGVCSPPARLDVCRRGNQELERKRRRDGRGRGGWSKEDSCSQLYFILFYFPNIIDFLEIRFSYILFYFIVVAF